MNIINLLSQWVLDPKKTTLEKRSSDYSKNDYHYFTEIVRHFNQIRFIVNKTRRSLSESNDLEITYYLLLTYRFFWERCTFNDIIRGFTSGIKPEDEKDLLAFYKRLLTWNWDISLKNKSKIEIISIRYSAPTFLIKNLLPVLEYNQIQQNIVAMDRRARKGVTYLRINNVPNSNNEISDQKTSLIDYFNKKRVKLEPVEHFPFLLKARVQDKVKIITSSYYQQKQLVFQEKASAASVYLLNPQSGDIIVDLCAAPGMKTSHLSQILKGKSTIIAGDFHHQRMKDMVTFLTSLGISDVNQVQWDGIKPPLKDESVDKVLLDAPCTGSGTFTSNPELKWKQSNNFLQRNVFLQQKLITAALRALKVGGNLVYSVCSLYPEEGEYQIQKLINENVTPAPTPSWLPPSYKINNSYLKGTGRFLPAKHNTIGFFVAKLIKN